MSIVSWIREKLHTDHSPRMTEALHLTDEIGEKARELRERLEPFKMERDPFIALWASCYETIQEGRIHEGPP